MTPDEHRDKARPGKDRKGNTKFHQYLECNMFYQNIMKII
jgi:hypothetical protein